MCGTEHIKHYKTWNTNLKIPNWPGSICIGTGLSSATQHLDLHWHGSSATNTWLHALSEHHLLHALQPQMEARLEDVIIILRTRTKPLTPWHWRWPQCRPRRGESSHQPSCNWMTKWWSLSSVISLSISREQWRSAWNPHKRHNNKAQKAHYPKSVWFHQNLRANPSHLFRTHNCMPLPWTEPICL